VVATDAQITKPQAQRLATVAHDGLARAINPVHTMSDGDTLFALGTGQSGRSLGLMTLFTLAAEAVALATARAILLAQQGRKADGLKILEEVKVNSPQDAKLKAMALSQWFREDKQISAAFLTIEKALAQFPSDPELQSEMAMLCEKLGRFEQMESLLRGLMKIKPTDPHAFNALGYSLADRKIRLNEARELILKAIQLAPRDPFIQDSLGWLEYRVGNTQEAIRILEAAFKERPDAEIAAHLGEVHWVTGNKEKAGTIWREGLMLKSDNETLLETLKQFQFKP
jgi:Flp pilus assembly protein TadD